MDNAENTRQVLSYVSVAYAVMFYAAAAVLLVGLALKITQYLREPPRLRPPGASGDDSRFGSTIRVATDVFLFRGTFFSDRVQWIFSAFFHIGLLLVILRHLRYALEPAWVGPLWNVVIVAQPLGLYGGLVMMAGTAGFWARRIFDPDIRRATTLSDHFMLGLFLLIPAVGYINNILHTDVIAVKEFFLGLIRVQWTNLPTDSMLLTHLWLVAVMMVALPFSQLLHLAGVFDKTQQMDNGRNTKARAAVAGVFGVLLLIPAAFAAGQVAEEGWTRPQPNFAKLARAHKNDDPTVMIRNHPNFLMNVRSITVYRGVRKDINKIEKCVDCHAVKGADGQPVGFDNPKHFCVGCHYRAAVSIDCFECHNSKPTGKDKAALDMTTKFAALAPRSNQRSSER